MKIGKCGFVLFLGAAAMVGCGDSDGDDSPVEDAANSVETDAGEDAGAEPEMDSGTQPPDAGPKPDAAATDSGVVHDAGEQPDAKAASDAKVQMDASDEPDASSANRALRMFIWPWRV